METLEFLGLLRSAVVSGYKPFHVRSGTQMISHELRPRLDEIQVALLNSNQKRVATLTDELNAEGVSIEAQPSGAVSYEVGDGIDIGTIVDRRLAFIAQKNWAEADKIRDELLAQGIQLKDGKDPVSGERVTTWEVKR